MPKLHRQGHIRSETHWITMIASKEGSIPRNEQDQALWYLTIYVNGIELEFSASEAGHLHLFTQEQATQRIKEFEDIISAEKNEYVQSLVAKLITSLK